ncbi:24553_t:CDS:2, partial [Gigaspora margarita]
INDLNNQEHKWIDWCKKWTVPNAKTTKGLPWNNHLWQNVVSNAKISQSAYGVVVGTWWSLSEEILDEPYSKFNMTVNGVTKSNAMIGPNDICLENAPKCGSCWQNGICGMEMSYITIVEVATAAKNIYKGKTYWT